MFLNGNRTRYLREHRIPGRNNDLWSGLVQPGLNIIILLFLVGNATGLINISSIQRPVWWLEICLWTLLIISTATIKLSPPHLVFFFRELGKALHASSPYLPAVLPDADVLEAGTTDQFIAAIPQIVDAFEIPFQRIGIRTEEHRHEIEKAVNTLYHRPNFDQQILTDCLQQLLRTAQQNWTELAAFSPREREIMELLPQNISYREIGSRLHVSISTVKTHVYHIFQKLDITTREDAIHLIRQRGWFYWSEHSSHK